MEKPLGERFARALAAKDFEAIRALLHPTVDFRALTPGRVWEATSSEQVVREILSSWFDESDYIDELLSVESGHVEDRERVGYRLAVHNADGSFIVDEQAYYEVAGGMITWMRMLCSGWRPTTNAQPITGTAVTTDHDRP